MWKRIEEMFAGLPAQKQVARKMVELGLSINAKGVIECGGVEVKEVSLARASGVDRRTVRATAAAILGDKVLSQIFVGIRPAGALLKEVAPLIGLGVIEIEANARETGIVAKAASLLAKRGISIRQAFAKDPELFENPTLTIITEKRLPGTLLDSLLKIRGVKKVSVY